MSKWAPVSGTVRGRTGLLEHSLGTEFSYPQTILSHINLSSMLPACNPRSATNLASLLLQHSINIHSSICSITYLASHNLISSSTPSTFLYISTPGQREYLEIPGMDHGETEGTAEPWNVGTVTTFRLLWISQLLQFPSFPDQETEGQGRKRFCLRFTTSLSQC